MTTKKSSGKVTEALDQAITDELAEVRRKHDADVNDPDGKVMAKKGEFVYPLPERMKVYDRALKLEAIKAKLDGTEWGSKFKKGGDA